MASALDDLKAGGLWTGGVYGTLGSLKSFLSLPLVNAAGVYAFFDHGVPSDRLDHIPEYKAERKEKRKLLTDEDKERAFAQLHTARKMLELLGVVCLAYQDREADDCIAAAVRLFARRGDTPIVVSGDRDMWQTVRMGARVWFLNGKHWVDAENFEEYVGIGPEHYVLYRALVGDPSDSIKGADGCGPKRAVQVMSDSIKGADGCGPKRAVQVIEEHAGVLNSDAPLKQLDALVSFLARKTKPRKYEANIVADAERLGHVVRGIDMDDSFGGTKGLKKRLAEKPTVDRMGFLRFCKGLAFKSVLGSPDMYLRPFERAAQRRDQ